MVNDHQSTKDEKLRHVQNSNGFKMKIVDKHGFKTQEREFSDISKPFNYESGSYAQKEQK